MTDPAAPQPQQPAPAAPFTEAEDKQYTVLATFLNIIPLIPALIFYFAFKDRGPRINNEGKEALNFGITLSVFVVVWNIIFGSIASANTPFSYFGISTGNAALFWIFGLLNWLVILGAVVVGALWSFKGAGVVKAGGSYRYPFSVRLIK